MENGNPVPGRCGKEETKLKQSLTRISVEQLSKENRVLKQLVQKRRIEEDVVESEVASIKNEIGRLKSRLQASQQQKGELMQELASRTNQLQGAEKQKEQLEEELAFNRLKVVQIGGLHLQSDTYRSYKIKKLEKNRTLLKTQNQDLQRRLKNLRSDIDKRSLVDNTLRFKIAKLAKQKHAYETSACQNNHKYSLLIDSQRHNRNQLQRQFQTEGIELRKMAQEAGGTNMSCLVCWDQSRQANLGLYPCGHLGFCRECLPDLHNRCPMCQTSIVREFEFYKA